MSGKNGGRKTSDIIDEKMSIKKIEVPVFLMLEIISDIKKSGITAIRVVAVEVTAAPEVKFTLLKKAFFEDELFSISKMTRAVSAINPVDIEIPQRMCSLTEMPVIERKPAVHKIVEQIITERINESFTDL